MVFRKALLCSYLFVALLSFAELHHATPARTVESVTEEASCINFCFAIDGSTSIPSQEFSRELFLATQITRTVPSSLNPSFAAVQYGITNSAITPLSPARFEVIRAIRSTSQQDAEGTFITGALNYCFSELFDVTVDGPICPKSVIILMGNGIENIGSDPAERSGLFVQEGGDVVAVGFGPEVDEKALMNINGDDDFFNANTRSIRNLAREILTKLGIEPISEDMVMSS